MSEARPRFRELLASRKLLVILALGAASGYPNQITESALQAWLKDLHVSNTDIGLFSYVAIPYLLKFLWAPLLDRYQLGWPGRRRDWMLVTQVALAALLFYAGASDLAAGPLPLLAAVAIAIAFLSATQDIAIDAWRDNAWQEIGKATSIGSCRLLRTGADIRAQRVRLRVTQAAACPALCEFSLFKV